MTRAESEIERLQLAGWTVVHDSRRVLAASPESPWELEITIRPTDGNTVGFIVKNPALKPGDSCMVNSFPDAWELANKLNRGKA